MLVAGKQSEAVFKVLDGHDFVFEGRPCHVEVYGVFDQGGHRWVQLALDSDRHQMLTLRVDRDELVDCALISLAS